MQPQNPKFLKGHKAMRGGHIYAKKREYANKHPLNLMNIHS